MSTTGGKVYAICFGLSFILYIGVAVTANGYLWLAIIFFVLITLFQLEAFLFLKVKTGNLLRFFPFLFLALFIYANESSRELITENPHSVTVFFDQAYNQERVLIKYGIYDSVTLSEVNIKKTYQNVELTSNGYILTEPVNPKIDIFLWLYVFIGIPIFLNAVIGFLNETRTNPYANKKGGRESVLSVLWGASHTMNTSNHRTAHISQDQNFLDEKTKSDMFRDEDKGWDK